MATYISVQTTENKLTRCDVRAPIYACWNQLVNADSVDDMRAIIRGAKPINAIEAKKIGCMQTSVSAIGGYNVVKQRVHAVTFAVEIAYLSENCEVIGEDARTYFVQLETGEIRRCAKAGTYFIAVE